MGIYCHVVQYIPIISSVKQLYKIYKKGGIAMEFRNVSTQDMHDTAYSNNTFDLPATESAIRTAVENSYNYLNRIQKSYVDIRRFIYSTDDLYVDSNGNVCLTIDKGFIEASDRYEYRNSPYYLKWLTMEEINSLTNIFSYIPIITIDNKSVFSYITQIISLRFCISGTS